MGLELPVTPPPPLTSFCGCRSRTLMCLFFIRRLPVTSSPIESKFATSCVFIILCPSLLKSQKPAHSRALPGHIHIVIFVLCLHGPRYFVATFALTHVSYRAPFWDSLQILRNVNLILFRRIQNRDEHFVVANAIGYAEFYSRSHDAVIRVYDDAGKVIEPHEHKAI